MMRLALGIHVLLSLAACSGPRTVWTGDTLRYLADGEPTGLCAGTPRYLDAYAQRIRELLDAPGLRIRYRWTKRVGAYCSPGLIACARGNQAFSPRYAHVHEVAHAAVYGAGHPSDFLGEGLAEALGGALHPAPPARSCACKAKNEEALMVTDPRIPAPRLNDVDYRNAGLFVRFLIDRFGLSRVLTLYSRERRWRVKAPGNYRTWLAGTSAELLRAIFGRSPEQLGDEFAASRRCEAGNYRLWPVECHAASPWKGDSWVMARSLSCADERTVNDDSRDIVWSYDSVDIPATGTYDVGLTSPWGAALTRAILHPCNEICPTASAHEVRDGSHSVALSRGRYLVHLIGTPDTGGTYRLVIRRRAGAPAGEAARPTR